MRIDPARRRLTAAVLALALAAAGTAQDEKPQAAGKFEGREWWFEASGAYAFPGEVGMDDEPGVLVAVSNAGLSKERLDRIWDRQYAIDQFHVNEEVLVVYFHFAKDGKYKGMNYYFGSGDGCGFCYDGAVESTVKIEKGRIHGKLELAATPDEPRKFDLSFDVPVAPSTYGTPLPADGGEPGKAYAAFHRALDSNKPAALMPLLDATDRAELENSGVEYMSSLREDHPTVSYKIVKGFAQGDNNALLLVEGETSAMKVEVEVHMVREDGTWRMYDEILQVKLGG